VVPSTQGRGGGATASVPGALRAAMGQQLDLAQLRSGPGLVLYENLAYAPIRAVVPGRVPVNSPRPNRAALGTDLTDTTPLTAAPAPAGTVLWGEAYDREWSASSGGRTLRHERAFGWANGFTSTSRGTVSIGYDAQWQRWAMLGGALVLWILVVWRWRRTRVRPDPVTRTTVSRSRRERTERYDPLTDVLDEDAFWWERV
jgi:hypothetical protein